MPAFSTRNAILAVALSVTVGIAFEQFLRGVSEGNIGLLFSVLVTALILGKLLLVKAEKKPVERDRSYLSAFILFFAWMVTLRASVTLTVLNVLATFFLIFLMSDIRRVPLSRRSLITHVAALASVPVQLLFNGVGVVRGLFGRNNQFLFQIVFGIALAVPFLVLFSMLFANADLVFGRIFEDLEKMIDLSWPWRIIVTAVAGIGAAGFFALSVQSGKPPAEKNLRAVLAVLPAGIVMGSIVVLFVFFIAIQVTYLFGGEAAIDRFDFTYADYARRGFFELMASAILTLAMLWGLDALTVRTSKNARRAFTGLSLAWIFCTVVISLSAFTRLSLYQEAYGFTAPRLYSFIALFLTAALLAIVAWKIWTHEGDPRFLKTVLFACIAFLLATNVLNPDAFIAKRNIAHLNDTGKIDTDYLATLSDDALPAFLPLMTSADPEVAHWAREHLSRRTQPTDVDWRFWRFSTWYAQRVLAGML